MNLSKGDIQACLLTSTCVHTCIVYTYAYTRTFKSEWKGLKGQVSGISQKSRSAPDTYVVPGLC